MSMTAENELALLEHLMNRAWFDLGEAERRGDVSVPRLEHLYDAYLVAMQRYLAASARYGRRLLAEMATTTEAEAEEASA